MWNNINILYVKCIHSFIHLLFAVITGFCGFGISHLFLILSTSTMGLLVLETASLVYTSLHYLSRYLCTFTEKLNVWKLQSHMSPHNGILSSSKYRLRESTIWLTEKLHIRIVLTGNCLCGLVEHEIVRPY